MIGLIHIPYWWHATLFEVLWLISGLIGAVMSTINVRDSWKDQPVVEQLRNDPAVHDRHWQMVALAAHGRLESQWTRLIICSLIISSGLFGVLQPNPLGGGTTWTGFVVTTTLVGIAGLTAHRSWRDYRQRNQMYELALGRTSVLAARLRAKHLNR